jgi:cytosine/adenosine deaminase-related metal-dependent hydrolase
MNIYAASYLLPINGSPLEGGAVVVKNGRIMAVDTLAALRKSFSAPVHEFPGAVLMPGLVNAHTHLELTHFPIWLKKSGADTTAHYSYVDWIMKVIQVKRQIGHDELCASLLEGFRLSIQNGTTMVGDILSARQLISLYNNAHVSGRLYLECIGHDEARYKTVLESLEHDIKLIPANLLPGISPHSPFTVSATLLQALLAFARSNTMPVTMHLAESVEESLFFLNSTGRIADTLYPFVGWDEYLPPPMGTTATKWLEHFSALSADFLAVHGVQLSPADIELLKKRAASVVLAPRSNHNLAVGKAPVTELLQAGIPLALGTDSLASNDSLSLWDEMRFLLDEFPQSFTPAGVVRMATIGGARAIQCDREAGTLETGKRADFILMETGTTMSTGNIYEQVLTDAKVCGVWCGGENVWRSDFMQL